MLLAASGCQRARPPADTLVVAQVAEPRSLDPHVTTALNDFRILVNVFEGLVGYRPGTLEPAPALAESWSVSDDGRVYTFRLRPRVRFHDGSAFDAEAVRFNFQRMLDPNHPNHDTGPFPLAFFFDEVETVEVVDPLTVRFRLKDPFAPFLSNLAYPAGLMVSPAAVRRWERDVGRHPSGTGAFRFVDWRPGERVRLERFSDYRGAGEGAPAAAAATPVEHLIFRPITDPMTRVAELLAGGPVPAAFDWAHDPDLKPYGHDQEAARALLADAGLADAVELTLLVPRGGSGVRYQDAAGISRGSPRESRV